MTERRRILCKDALTAIPQVGDHLALCEFCPAPILLPPEAWARSNVKGQNLAFVCPNCHKK